MKKLLICFLTGLLIVVSFALSACSNDKGGSYYPSNEEMKINLEANGYVVVLYQDLSDTDGNHHDGTLVYASKQREGEQEEYLYFYRFTNADSCEYFFDALERECKNYNSLSKIENDANFGNIVFCGTENAVNAAGIKVVKVDVNVKV